MICPASHYPDAGPNLGEMSKIFSLFVLTSSICLLAFIKLKYCCSGLKPQQSINQSFCLWHRKVFVIDHKDKNVNFFIFQIEFTKISLSLISRLCPADGIFLTGCCLERTSYRLQYNCDALIFTCNNAVLKFRDYQEAIRKY